MQENENLVLDVSTENVAEQPTEEAAQTPAKTYTQEEVDEIVGKKKLRVEAKLRKEFSRKYGDLEATLSAGLGTKTVEEATEKLQSFYQDRGIEIPKIKELSDGGQKELDCTELLEMGVSNEVLQSDGFKSFAEKFNEKATPREIYEIYTKTQPKNEIKLPGSMKSTASDSLGVKDFYSPEEARKFTKKDFDKNPDLFKAVERSMQKW